MRQGRKALCAVTITAGLVAAGPAAAGAAGALPAPATPGAVAAAVYDPGTGRLLFAKDADRHLSVASLVKLMTVRLALESGDLDRVVTVPAGVTSLPETKVALVPGERLPLRELLPALMVRSANDAAYTIATALGGDEGGFARRMNDEAQRLGLHDTHYVNSSGLDAPGQYSSAADVARLAAADLTLPGFAGLVDRPSVTVGGRVYGTVNPFLAYYPGATGIKTGFTSAAMFCLAASAVRNGHTLIAVVLGEPDWQATDADAAALLNWGFAVVARSAASPATPGVPSSALPADHPEAPAAAAAPAVGEVPAAVSGTRVAGAPSVSPPATPTPRLAPSTTSAAVGPAAAAMSGPAPPLPWLLAGSVVAGIAGLLGQWLRRR